MKQLSETYDVKVDQISKEAWFNLLTRFEDANLYQTWSYDSVHRGDRGISHVVVKKEGVEVAAAQARIVILPGISKGIAYVRWGPLWKLSGYPEDLEIFRQAIRALRNEFSVRRGLVLRIYPMAFRSEQDTLEEILFDEGYTLNEKDAERTLILDLSPTIAEIRASFDDKWRNHLNRAEKNQMELIMGGEDHLFETIQPIYDEMVKRKGFEATGNIDHLRKVQKDLPDRFKMKVILCLLDGKICGGAIYSAIGSTGMSLIRATTELGMKTNGAYLIQWAFVKWLKEMGFRRYDLNGINPETNPGTYKFKRGLAGKKGQDVYFLGRYQVCDNRLSAWIIRCGEAALSQYRRMRTSKTGVKTK